MPQCCRAPQSIRRTGHETHGSLLHTLSVSTDVETRCLSFFADAESDGDRDEHQQDQTDYQRVGRAGADTDELRGDAAFDAADGDRGEHAGEHRADDAADGVNAEGIERIVVAE